jgi:general secretion pathway protein F
MKTFEYKGFNFEGHARKGLVEALDINEAREMLAKDGVLARKIVSVEQGESGPGRGGDKFNADIRATAYRELGSLLRSGLPMVKALEILIEAPEMDSSRRILAGMRDSIREGSSVCDAFDRASESVSAFEKGLITVGERSGRLGEMLDQLASYIEQQEVLRERIITALIYPAVVVAVAIALMIGVFAFIMPQTNRMLVEMDVPVPAITRFMMGIGRVVLIGVVPVILLMIFGVSYIRRRMRQDDVFRRRAVTERRQVLGDPAHRFDVGGPCGG